MKRFLEILLKIFRWLTAIFLVIVLLLTSLILIPVAGITWQVGNKDTLKSWVKESGVYQYNKELVIEALNSTGETGEGITEIIDRLKDPNDDLTKLIDAKINPQFLESSVNNIIDGFFGWASGNSGNKIELDIRVANDRTDLINILTTLFREKVKALPECEKGVTVPEDQNPISLSCLPKNYDLNKVNEYINANKDSAEFENLFTQVQFGEQAVPVDTQTSRIAPWVFWALVLLPYLLPVYLISMLLLISWLLPISKKVALVLIGIIVSLVPLVYAIGLLIINLRDLVLRDLVQTKLSESMLLLYQKYLASLANLFIGNLTNGIIIYCLVVLLIMVLSVVVSVFILTKLAERKALIHAKT